MNAELLITLGISLALTIVLETIFFFVSGKRDKMDFLLLVLVNVLTNPVVVLIYWLCAVYTSWNAYLIQIPLEISAVLVEGFCFYKYGREFKRPYLFAIAVNAFSYFAGILLRLLLS